MDEVAEVTGIKEKLLNNNFSCKSDHNEMTDNELNESFKDILQQCEKRINDDPLSLSMTQKKIIKSQVENNNKNSKPNY